MHTHTHAHTHACVDVFSVASATSLTCISCCCCCCCREEGWCCIRLLCCYVCTTTTTSNERRRRVRAFFVSVSHAPRHAQSLYIRSRKTIYFAPRSGSPPPPTHSPSLGSGDKRVNGGGIDGLPVFFFVFPDREVCRPPLPPFFGGACQRLWAGKNGWESQPWGIVCRRKGIERYCRLGFRFVCPWVGKVVQKQQGLCINCQGHESLPWKEEARVKMKLDD